MMDYPEFVLKLPSWVNELVTRPGIKFATIEDRMSLAIDLARSNVHHGTGGPFGAAVFDQHTNMLLAPGVNLVVSANCSMLHAEVVAITIAQQVVQTYDLGMQGLSSYELVTSTEPCAMCLGAVPWSGVRRLVCGARDEDARRVGFDEGPKPADWVYELESRGIAVVRDVCRQDAVAVLQAYAQQGGVIYNARQGGTR
jgi:tRNA(Arg) A34 adenosine deaminase TadA